MPEQGFVTKRRVKQERHGISRCVQLLNHRVVNIQRGFARLWPLLVSHDIEADDGGNAVETLRLIHASAVKDGDDIGAARQVGDLVPLGVWQLLNFPIRTPKGFKLRLSERITVHGEDDDMEARMWDASPVIASCADYGFLKCALTSGSNFTNLSSSSKTAGCMKCVGFPEEERSTMFFTTFLGRRP